MKKPRIAITHHWLTSLGGAEKVLFELHRMYPEAPIYTTAYIPSKFPELKGADVRVTFLDKIPFLKYKHQLFPMFLGTPFKTLDMSEYDIVISNDAAEAKYVRTRSHTLHICYCHTPVRYYWSDYEWRLNNMPFGKLNWLARIFYPLLVGRLRKIDYAAAQEVSVFVANSLHIQQRIKKYYHRDSTVIYPPVESEALSKLPSGKRDYYLIVGRQVASKRLDVAVDAFNELRLPLKVVGRGEEIDRQKPRAKDNIEWLGFVSIAERNRLFAGAKGFVFPPEEDFGVVPVEAMAAGTPVIAYRKGGAPEYVVDGKTGVLFEQQSGPGLVEAVRRFEKMKFDEDYIREWAKRWDVSIFRLRMGAFVDEQWSRFEAAQSSSK
jgi:glycosyltransferase involved in cell wall biosynthesis